MTSLLFMARWYRRRRGYRISRPMKRAKYSCETSYIGAVIDNDNLDFAIPIMSTNTTYFGMRKVKNFTLNLMSGTGQTTAGLSAQDAINYNLVLGYALVYVPQSSATATYTGQLADFPVSTGAGAVSLYEPNQNVIMQGVGNVSLGTIRNFTKLARNLNSGDNIYLLIRLYTPWQSGTGKWEVNIYGTVKFSICLG